MESSSCENAQPSLRFHFSSSVLAAHGLKECTAGQPAAHPDSTQPCFPSLHHRVLTCPPLAITHHELGGIFICSPALDKKVYLALNKPHDVISAQGAENKTFRRWVDNSNTSASEQSKEKVWLQRLLGLMALSCAGMTCATKTDFYFKKISLFSPLV